MQEVRAGLQWDSPDARSVVNTAIRKISALPAEITAEITAALVTHNADAAANSAAISAHDGLAGAHSAAFAALLADDNTFSGDNIFSGAVDIEDTTPAAPAADTIRHFTAKLSRSWPSFKTEDGFQPLVAAKNGSLWHHAYAVPGGSSIVSVGGGVSTSDSSGHADSAGSFAATNFRTRNRYNRGTSTAAAGNRVTWRSNLDRFYRSSTSGVGGFRAEFLFALGANTTGFQLLVGMAALAGGLAGDPSAQTNCFFLGFDAADTSGTNFFIMHNDGAGTCTRVDSGMARDTTSAFRLVLDCPPGASTMYWHLTNMNSGTVVSGSISSNLPTTDTIMNHQLQYRNGAVASAAIIDFYLVSVEGPVN